MLKKDKLQLILRAKYGSQIPKYITGGITGNPYMTSDGLATPGPMGLNLAEISLPDVQLAPVNFNNLQPLNYTDPLKGVDTRSSFKRLMNNDLFKQSGQIIGNIGMGITNGLINLGRANQINSSGVDTAFGIADTVSNIAGKINPVVGSAISGATTIFKGIDTLFGSKSKEFGINKNTLSQVGGSYGGSVATIKDAESKAGKKYGLFSFGARNEANKLIDKATAQQNTMTMVADEASDQRSRVNNLAYTQNQLDLNGGYNQKYIRAAKLGIKLQDKIDFVIARRLQSRIDVNTKQVEEFKNGGQIEWVPEIILDIESFKDGGQIEWKPEIIWEPEIQEFQQGGKTRTLEQLIAYAKKQNPRFIQRLSEPPHGIEFVDDKGNKGTGNVYLEWSTDDEGNAIIYPRIQEMEDKSLKFLSGDEAQKRANKNNNILVMSPEEARIFFAEDPEYQTAYKRGWPEMFKNYSKKVKSSKQEYPQEYIDFKNSLPANQRNTSETEYDTYRYWQLWGKPKNFEYTLTHPDEEGYYMYTWDNSDQSYHANSIAWGKDGIGYFMKPKHHSTIKYELDYYQNGTITEEGGKQRRPNAKELKDWQDFRNRYDLIKEGNFYRYVPKKSSTKELKVGGTLKEELETPEIEETNQKNLIPEGALHKNKHHMEHTEGLTQKGIPVVDNEGEQQAEIELDEIIFTLEVTKKLEELYKDGSDKAAIEAGKLLVKEILFNTDDRTNLIAKCEKGGKLNDVK